MTSQWFIQDFKFGGGGAGSVLVAVHMYNPYYITTMHIIKSQNLGGGGARGDIPPSPPVRNTTRECIYVQPSHRLNIQKEMAALGFIYEPPGSL